MILHAERALADDGCITYTRGTVTIVDHEQLHAHACDCHDVIRRAFETGTRG